VIFVKGADPDKLAKKAPWYSV